MSYKISFVRTPKENFIQFMNIVLWRFVIIIQKNRSIPLQLHHSIDTFSTIEKIYFDICNSKFLSLTFFQQVSIARGFALIAS